MTANEEESLSRLLDNEIVLEAVTTVITLHDTGFHQGYADGLAGKPTYPHSEYIPELFKHTYSKGHEAGLKERERKRLERIKERADRKVCAEIAAWEKRIGACREERSPSTAAEPKKVNNVLEPQTQQQQQQQQQQQTLWQKYGAPIVGFVAGGVVFGALGMFFVAKERKKCMDVRKEMGIQDK